MQRHDDEGADVLKARFSGRMFGAAPPSAAAPAAPSAKSSASPVAQPTIMFGAVDREARKARERKSTKTAKQRLSRARRTEVVNFRCTPELVAAMEKASEAAGITRTDLIEQALDAFLNRQPKKAGGKA